MIPVENPFKTILPVFESPSVNDCLAVVASVPVAVKYAPPVVPAERVAVGEPVTPSTANLAEVVPCPPTAKSSVELIGARSPEVCCHQLVPVVEAMVMAPDAFVIETPVPAVRFAKVYPV